MLALHEPEKQLHRKEENQIYINKVNYTVAANTPALPPMPAGRSLAPPQKVEEVVLAVPHLARTTIATKLCRDIDVPHSGCN